MKDEILRLRSEGKSYREIVKELGCSKGTVSFHCAKGAKQATFRRRIALFKKNMMRLKEQAGGKCSKCGYDRCMLALDFHHVDPRTKNRDYTCMSQILRCCSVSKAEEEAKKCILLCANCHREHHALE